MALPHARAAGSAWAFAGREVLGRARAWRGVAGCEIACVGVRREIRPRFLIYLPGFLECHPGGVGRIWELRRKVPSRAVCWCAGWLLMHRTLLLGP